MVDPRAGERSHATAWRRTTVVHNAPRRSRFPSVALSLLAPLALSQLVPADTSTSSNPNVTPGNGGQANVSLRGLGTTGTPVRVDGKRLIPAKGDGVENLTDEDPPVLAYGAEANTDPSQYDVLGRRYFASLRYTF